MLEFWATWCAPCIAEIPVLNALAESVAHSSDASKVAIISVDDEEPSVVERFLKTKPISGWVGLDTSGDLYRRYGVLQRPTTIIIGPDGRVVTTTRPEEITRQKLVALANSRPASFAAKPDEKVQAQSSAALAQAFAEQTGQKTDATQALFEIALSPSAAGNG